MSYSLTTYSPYEGYRIAFNGTKGRLEAWVQERQPWPKKDYDELRLTTNFGEAKKRLAELMIEYFRPFRQKRIELENDIAYVKEVLANGAERARAVAVETLGKVRKAVGLGG